MIVSETPRADATTAMDIMPALVARFSLDRQCLERLWNVPYSRRRSERLQAFFGEWQGTLAAMPFGDLSRADRADWLLLDSVLSAQCRRLQEREQTPARPQRDAV